MKVFILAQVQQGSGWYQHDYSFLFHLEENVLSREVKNNGLVGTTKNSVRAGDYLVWRKKTHKDKRAVPKHLKGCSGGEGEDWFYAARLDRMRLKGQMCLKGKYPPGSAGQGQRYWLPSTGCPSQGWKCVLNKDTVEGTAALGDNSLPALPI